MLRGYGGISLWERGNEVSTSADVRRAETQILPCMQWLQLLSALRYYLHGLGRQDGLQVTMASRAYVRWPPHQRQI